MHDPQLKMNIDNAPENQAQRLPSFKELVKASSQEQDFNSQSPPLADRPMLRSASDAEVAMRFQREFTNYFNDPRHTPVGSLPDVRPSSPSLTSVSPMLTHHRWASESVLPTSPPSSRPPAEPKRASVDMPKRHFALTESEDSNFVLDPNGKVIEKPPYSYSALIEMAIEATPTKRMMLNEIYEWIIENFKFYKYSTKNWKVPRQGHGKGNYWTVDHNSPGYLSSLSPLSARRLRGTDRSGKRPNPTTPESMSIAPALSITTNRGFSPSTEMDSSPPMHRQTSFPALPSLNSNSSISTMSTSGMVSPSSPMPPIFGFASNMFGEPFLRSARGTSTPEIDSLHYTPQILSIQYNQEMRRARTDSSLNSLTSLAHVTDSGLTSLASAAAAEQIKGNKR